MKPANFAPIYACLYPELAEITRQHGYALAAHGSLARDFDLVCIPWVDKPSKPQTVVDAITKAFCVQQCGAPSNREHGRLVYSLSLSFGECFLDFSFMPCQNQPIYDWPDIPPEVKWMATDKDMVACGWLAKPHIMGDSWCLPSHMSAYLYIQRRNNPFKGDWTKSLEARPQEVAT